jgi:hypothetical protein
MTNVVGTTPSRFYNDVYFPDNNSGGTTVTNSTAITKAGTAPYFDTRFAFENVTTPYTGANTILIDYQGATSVANMPVDLQIYNYNSSTWETLNGGPMQAGVNTFTRWQFSKAVTNWAYYINPSAPNDIRVRLYQNTNATATILYVDYLRLTLGTTVTSADTATIPWGTSFLNDKTATDDVDSTLAPLLTANTDKAWFVSTAAPTSETGENVNSVSANINLAATRPTGTLVTGIRWAMRAPALTNITANAYIRDTSGNYNLMANNQFMGWGVAAFGMAPIAADGVALTNTAPGPFLSGVQSTNPDDSLDTFNNNINIAIRTSASTSLVEQPLIWDLAFISLRYVGP